MRKWIYALRNCPGSHLSSICADGYLHIFQNYTGSSWELVIFQAVYNTHYHYNTVIYLTKCCIKSLNTCLFVLKIHQAINLLLFSWFLLHCDVPLMILTERRWVTDRILNMVYAVRYYNVTIQGFLLYF